MAKLLPFLGNKAVSEGVKWFIIVVLILISLMANDVRNLFMGSGAFV